MSDIKAITPAPLDLVPTRDLIHEISRRSTHHLIILIKPEKTSKEHFLVETSTDMPATPQALRAARRYAERAILRGKEPPNDPISVGS